MNTRRYPRTMQQAFGPYTDDRLHPMPERRMPSWFERLLIRICGF
jgi:hypothetical protein